MALFGKKNKDGAEKKEGFFSRFRKKEKDPQAQEDVKSETPSPPAAEEVPETPQIEPAQTHSELPAPAQPLAVMEPADPVVSLVTEIETDRQPTKEEPVPVLTATPVPEAVADVEEAPAKLGFMGKLKAGLKKTRDALMKGRLGALFLATRKIDEDLLEEIEEMLISSDIGVQTTMDIIDTIRRDVDRSVLKNGEQLKEAIKKQMLHILAQIPQHPLDLGRNPTVVLIVGVNGVGKTTTIGKVANVFRKQGKSVVVCAADTFRAAAVEQLEVWARRAGVEIVLKHGSKDPAAVVFEALKRVKETNAEVLLVDTAGRLHNNPNLMNELDKIRRITTREFAESPHNVFLILDAITGQNGLQQAKQFVEKVGVTDLIITKMDGTAKGGIAIAIAKELNLPIRFIGVGEQMDDLLPFDPEAFVNSLFDNE